MILYGAIEKKNNKPVAVTYYRWHAWSSGSSLSLQDSHQKDMFLDTYSIAGVSLISSV